MIEVKEYRGEGFLPLVDFEAWRVAFLRCNERFSALTTRERHLATDEVFVLLTGQATLYAWDENDAMQALEMEGCKVYNVPKGVWHHIVASPDATVLVVENSNTVKENTERRVLTEC